MERAKWSGTLDDTITMAKPKQSAVSSTPSARPRPTSSRKMR